MCFSKFVMYFLIYSASNVGPREARVPIQLRAGPWREFDHQPPPRWRGDRGAHVGHAEQVGLAAAADPLPGDSSQVFFH